MTSTTRPASAVSAASILGWHGLPGGVRADAPALTWGTHHRTYGQLRARAQSLAHAFHVAGARPGDRVLVHLPNRGEIFEVYFACAYAGLTVVPTNFRFRSRELALVLEDVEPAVIVTESNLGGIVAEAVAEAGHSPRVVELPADESGPVYEDMATGPSLVDLVPAVDPHLVLFTSGTTGRPKGITMSHRCILDYAAQQVVNYPAIDGASVLLIVPPLFNAGGINDLAIATFLMGGHVVLFPSGGWSATALLEAVDRHSVTHAIWFPTMIKPILARRLAAATTAESLKAVIVGGEHCTPTALRELRAAFPQTQFVNTYGLTEAGLVTFLPHDEFELKPESVGRVSRGGQAIDIRGADGRSVAAGEVGEIWTTSNFLPEGYWNAPELTAESHRDGWLNTGDLGRMDADGYLYIEGRERDMIISKGQNIYPAEIESVLMEIPGVTACTVVGIPDQEFGETPHAVVVSARDDLTSDEVTAHLNARLASFKRPRVIHFWDSLPISDANKVRKAEVRELILTVPSSRGDSASAT